MRRMTYPSFLFAVPAALAGVAACGGSASTPAAGSHEWTSPPATGSPQPTPAPTGPACTTTSDCASGTTCLFPVGSCAAQGECLDPDSLGGECDHIVSYCGCDGQSVAGLCGPDYAYGPTLGQSDPCGPAPTFPAGATLKTLSEQTQSAPEELATDGVNVYVAGVGSGTVVQVPGGGGAAVTLATDQEQPFGIATNGTSVFWTNQASGGNGTVMKVAVGGGTPVTLASGQGAPTQIAFDATNVYWLTIGGPNAVMTVPIAGGTPSLFAAASSPWALATDGATVYWTDGDTIFSAPRDGGTPTTLASGQPFPFALAVDGTTLYFSTARGDGAILSMPKTGGTPTTLASQTGMARIAIDATTLYFTNQGGAANAGVVSTLPLSGGGAAATTLVTGQASPEGIAVDASRVYWVDTGIGAVMALSPK
jgi:hypothetical protein